MKYTKLGNTGIKVSQLCLGGMSFGEPSEDFHMWTLDADKTEEIVKKALENGINYFDTANTYSHGTSEEYLGRALKNNVARDKVVIQSKVFFNKGHLSKEAIEREIDLTLQRLGTDFLDSYVIHRFDYRTPVEETMEALDGLVKAGKVRMIGASSMYTYQFIKLQHAAEKNGFTQFSVMQDHYNLIYREEEREMIPYCKENNISLTPYSSLAGGHLSRPEWKTESLRSQTDKHAAKKYDGTMESDIQIVGRVNELANEKGCSMTALSLAWLLKKGIASPIIGPTKVKYIEDAVKCFDVDLTDEDMNYLEELYVPHNIVGPQPAPKPNA